MNLPKRLIEVDLPIARISAHARREKSIRHGHISTLHIWWARRPLAACRAVICAALWPDPADDLCPPAFRTAAIRIIGDFARLVKTTKLGDSCEESSRKRWETLAGAELHPDDPSDLNVLRFALLDFIADFANWDNSTVPAYLETSRALTQAAHEALGGEPRTRPLVVDPFAGGGSIPLEAIRVGADAFASDLNPVAVLLNKVVLEYIPKYGQKLADEVRKWGAWIKEQAEKELAEFYPKDEDGATPIAYLWARTIRCEGIGCGAEVPLMRSLWLAKKANNSVALKIVPNKKSKRVDFEIVENANDIKEAIGTVKRGSVTCPVCEFTTPLPSVKRQFKERLGGTADARLLCVVTSNPKRNGRTYRLPNAQDMKAVKAVVIELERRRKSHHSELSLLPEESTEGYHTFVNRGPIYGMSTWQSYFSPRQCLALSTIGELIKTIALKINTDSSSDSDIAEAVQTCLGLALGRLADRCSSLCTWDPSPAASGILHTFARQALPFVWDYAEGMPFEPKSGGWLPTLEWIILVIQKEAKKVTKYQTAHVQQASATRHPLPNASVNAVITDPPYYYSVQYSDLSDFFYVWLRRVLNECHVSLFKEKQAPKDDEIIVQSPGHQFSKDGKNNVFYEARMQQALTESRRILLPTGVCVVVFAHTSTAGWEALLQAMIGAGWTITGSWPIDTEMSTRVIAQGRSVLASSVHLVCRPRIGNDIGDWRDILSELPNRMHEWMPRLASEGVVGADAIFACLGPALEIFSRYSRVEKANGDAVPLKEYLEQVWAAVSKEALSVIFRDADATGLEPDARLTAMWLWTVGGGKAVAPSKESDSADDEADEADDEDEKPAAKAAPTGFGLEFDAARKIAQGLGIHLEKSESIVEVKGDKARLLAVAERTKHLFGKDSDTGPTAKKPKKKPKQGNLFEELGEAEEAVGGWKELKGPPPGTTILDRLHQSMILFGAQRGELLKRFLVEDGVGKDARFWKLAQSLAALYPTGTDERRWVEGVLARKKGLGL